MPHFLDPQECLTVAYLLVSSSRHNLALLVQSPEGRRALVLSPFCPTPLLWRSRLMHAPRLPAYDLCTHISSLSPGVWLLPEFADIDNGPLGNTTRRLSYYYLHQQKPSLLSGAYDAPPLPCPA